jgi:hypothetical protein
MATYTNEDLLDSVQRLNVPVCRIQMILDSGQVDVDCVIFMVSRPCIGPV